MSDLLRSGRLFVFYLEAPEPTLFPSPNRVPSAWAPPQADPKFPSKINQNLTGFWIVFERVSRATLVLKTNKKSIKNSIDFLIDFLIGLGMLFGSIVYQNVNAQTMKNIDFSMVFQ